MNGDDIIIVAGNLKSYNYLMRLCDKMCGLEDSEEARIALIVKDHTIIRTISAKKDAEPKESKPKAEAEDGK